MTAEAGTIRVLHVDDEPDFAELAATFLERRDERLVVETATTIRAGLDRVAEDEYDCIVSDYDLPGQDGIEFLETIREDRPDLPFILFTGKGSEAVASEAISGGATDYLQKEPGTSQFAVLANLVDNAVEQYRTKRDLAASERRLSLFIDQSSLGVIEWDVDFTLVRMNAAAEAILGYTEEELVGRSWEPIVPGSESEPVEAVVDDLLEDRGGYHSINENVRKDGERIVCEWHNRVVTDEGDEVVAIFSQFQDVTERHAREQAVEDLHGTTRALMDADTPGAVAEITVNAARDILDLAFNGVHLYDASADELVPVAWTTEGEALAGEIPSFMPGESLAWDVFDSGEMRTFDDVSTTPGRQNPDTTIRAEVIIPLDEHGVMVIGADEPDAFDEVDVSLAQLLAAHATSALDRIQREQELDRQRSLLEAQQEAVLDGILVIDEDREILSYNERFVDLWDLPSAVVEAGEDYGVLTMATDLLAHPEEFHAKVAHLYEHPEETSRDEVELIDGRVFDRYTTPLFGEDGTHYGRLWTFRDVTARRDRERRLEQLVQRTQELIEAGNRNETGQVAVDIARTVLDAPLAGVHLLSEDGERLEAVAAMDEVRAELGIPPTYERAGDDAASSVIWAVFDEGAPRYIDDTRTVGTLADESPARSGVIHPLGAHGVLIISTTVPEAFDQTDRMYAELLAQTLTAALDRVEREAVLRRNERRLKGLHRATESLLQATSPQQVADRVVDAAEDILGFPITVVRYHREEAGGLVPVAATDSTTEVLGSRDVFGPESGSLNWAAYESGTTAIYEDIGDIDGAIDSDTPIASLMLLPLGEHGTISVADTKPQSFDAADTFHGELLARTAALVLSQLDRAAALVQQRDALDHQNERLAQFASVVSHDLRNPLNVAQGRLELATEDCDSEHLSAVRRAVDRMETLIDDVLALARAGELLGKTEPVDLAAVAERSWTNVDTTAARLLIESTSVVEADQSRLQQLFENLFRNAVEHGGADVSVTVGDLPDGFYVEDTGRGIPEAQRETVFEAGYSTGDGGTGFGLSIVKEIAQAHGWAIAVTAGSAGGARFEFNDIEPAGE